MELAERKAVGFPEAAVVVDERLFLGTADARGELVHHRRIYDPSPAEDGVLVERPETIADEVPVCDRAVDAFEPRERAAKVQRIGHVGPVVDAEYLSHP